jgi:hypothetical protein
VFKTCDLRVALRTIQEKFPETLKEVRRLERQDAFKKKAAIRAAIAERDKDLGVVRAA